MSKLIPTNRHNPCPVCDDTSGKCRTTESELVLCMVFSGAKPREIISGYRFLKLDKSGLWGNFVPDKDADYDPEYIAELHRQRELQREKESQKKLSSLTLSERDRQIRKLHSGFGLSRNHHENLRKRGLTQDQIELGLFFTVQPNQIVPHGVSDELPGISQQQLQSGGYGFACPAFDPQGRASTWQIRLDKATENKYRWAKAPHLSNGELPLTFCDAEGSGDSGHINLVEGLLKPYVAANRFNQVFLGAASANFATGPQQFEEFLGIAAKKLGARTVVLNPDAGATANPHVIRSYQRAWELAQELGYKVLVRWWGQAEKGAKDVDELTSDEFSRTSLIDLNSFIALCRQHGGTEASNQRTQAQTLTESYWFLGHPRNETSETRYLEISAAAREAKFLAIKSPMNSGKTYALAAIAREAKTVLIIVNTIALAEALAVRYGCMSYGDSRIQNGETLLNDCDRLVITNESLWKIRTIEKRFEYVIVDEADQVIGSAVASSTTRERRHQILTTLECFARKADHFVLMDADLSSITLDAGEHLCGSKPFVLENTRIPHAGKKFYKYSNQVDHVNDLVLALEADEKVLIVCDTKTLVKKIGTLLGGFADLEGIRALKEGDEIIQALQALFPEKKGRVIHGDNSGDPSTRKFIKNITSAIKEEGLDYLVFNNTLQSGVSIETLLFEGGSSYFDQMFCLFSGMVLSHTELGQVCHRLRPDCRKSVSFPEINRPWRETSAEKIRDDLIKNDWEECALLGINPKTGGLNDPIVDFRVKLEARRNWSLNNVEEAFQAHLEGLGYEVIEYEDPSFLLPEFGSVEERLKENGKAIKQIDLNAIAEAPEITKEEREALRVKPTQDYDDRAMATKYDIEDFTGMAPREELITRWVKGEIIKPVTRLEALIAEDSTQTRLSDLYSVKNNYYVYDRKRLILEVEVMKNLKLTEYLDPEKAYTTDDLEPLAIASRAQKERIKRVLGITIFTPPQTWEKVVGDWRRVSPGFFGSSDLLSRWSLNNLASAASRATAPTEPFANQEEADQVCSKLSTLGKLITEMEAIAVRCKILSMSPQKIHAAFCDSLGLSRVRSRKGNKLGYAIKKEDWDFSTAVLAHRKDQRLKKEEEKNTKFEEEATRFDQMTPEAVKKAIAEEIANAFAQNVVIEPDLVIEESASDFEADPPQNNQSVYIRGGLPLVLENLSIGDQVQVLSSQAKVGTVTRVVTGLSEKREYIDYFQVAIDGVQQWIPRVLCRSVNGEKITRNPVPDLNHLPKKIKDIWVSELVDVKSVRDLIDFESRHTAKEIEVAADNLNCAQLRRLQCIVDDLDLSRDYIPPSIETDPLVELLEAAAEDGELLAEHQRVMAKVLAPTLLKRVWVLLSQGTRRQIGRLCAADALALNLNRSGALSQRRQKVSRVAKFSSNRTAAIAFAP